MFTGRAQAEVVKSSLVCHRQWLSSVINPLLPSVHKSA